mmetsp:Transcript_38969/g.62451  ORF Transcript_38969/g.62451 Transcript_38969/m.62451 type:complete len:101 (-) Transcript_38969:297-599(-)
MSIFFCMPNERNFPRYDFGVMRKIYGHISFPSADTLFVYTMDGCMTAALKLLDCCGISHAQWGSAIRLKGDLIKAGFEALNVALIAEARRVMMKNQGTRE